MKRILFVLLFVIASLAASASSVHYFTATQTNRVVRYLNEQDELMIYCAYANELETYVLLNEVWAEPVNSRYYEIWIYGYDAYTGEEIMMPIDLECIWFQRGHKMYNAAEFLRFRCTVPVINITWTIPAYNTYVRAHHPAVYTRTYHYDVHRYGWVPPAPHHEVVIHPYYMRRPIDPLPVYTERFTPGKDVPKVISNKVQPTTSRPAPTTTARTNVAGSSTNGVINNSNRPTNATVRPTPSSNNNNNPSGNNPPRPNKSTTTTTTTTTTTSTTSRPSVAGTSRPATTTTTTTTTQKSTTSSTARPTTSTTSRPSTTTQSSASQSKAPKSATTTTKSSTTSTTRPNASSSKATTTRSNNNSSSSRPSSNTSRPTSTTSRPK